MINMILLDLDPNVVKPGWTPLIITIVLAAAIVLLYLSMRNQVRRINVPYENADAESAPDAGDGPEAGPVAAGTAGTLVAEATPDADVPSKTTRPAS